MHGLSLHFIASAIVILCLGSVVGLLVYLCHSKLRRVRERERLSRQVEDALVQNAQGLILNVHGIVKELPTDDPTRLRMESALDRADQQLSNDRDRVQDLRLQAMLEPEKTPAWRSRLLLWWNKRSR